MTIPSNQSVIGVDIHGTGEDARSMSALQFALADIATAQRSGDITIAAAGRIVSTTAARLTAVAPSVVTVDPFDLAAAVAAHLKMSQDQRLALIASAMATEV